MEALLIPLSPVEQEMAWLRAAKKNKRKPPRVGAEHKVRRKVIVTKYPRSTEIRKWWEE